MKKLMRSPVPRAQSLLSHQNRLPYSVRACLEKGQVAVDSDRNLGLVGRSTTFTWKTEGWVSRVYIIPGFVPLPLKSFYEYH